MFRALSEQYGFSLDVPVRDLPEDVIHLLLYGNKGEKIAVKYPNLKRPIMQSYEGIIPNLERRYQYTESEYMKAEIEEYMSEVPCPDCGGKRLKKEVLAVTVGGKNIYEYCTLPVTEAKDFIEHLTLSPKEEMIAHRIIKEIRERLGFLQSVGLEYLTLSRLSLIHI